MTTLVVGATGATGRLVVKELLDRGVSLRVIVRTPDRLPPALVDHAQLHMIHARVLDLSDAEMVQLVNGCDAVVSCLGHTLSWRGIFGQPRRLVSDATRRLCAAMSTSGSDKPVKFILMNTVANSNRDLDEPNYLAHRLVIGLVRLLLPPQKDNEMAAEYLRAEIGRGHKAIEWVAVRPDTLIDEDEVTEYELHPSPTRSGVFNPGKTSRINVAHLMAELVVESGTWNRWKGQMPVIYNRDRTVE